MTAPQSLVFWERFNERARRVVFFAQEEAARLGEARVGTEHILLGLCREADSSAAVILDRVGVSLSLVRREIERHVTRGQGNLASPTNLTTRALKVLNLAIQEADSRGEAFAGSEHLLMGLLAEGDGLAARVLDKLGATLATARQELENLPNLSVEPEASVFAARRSSPDSGRPSDARDRIHRLLSDARESRANLLEAGSDLGSLEWLAALSDEELSQAGPRECASVATTLARSVCGGLTDLRGIGDLNPDSAWALLYLGVILKRTLALDPRAHESLLPRRVLAMLFEKPSLRTRVSFETGIFQMGGYAIHLPPGEIAMGVREPVPDVARNLSGMVNGIVARVFANKTIVELAEHATVPVINGLCDWEHPCQALADMLTLWEKRGAVAGKRITYVGDGNNTAHSLIWLAAMMGASATVACPPGYEPDPGIVSAAQELALRSGQSVTVSHDPAAACAGADVVYTDVWASMGQEREAAERAKVFAPFQVTDSLLSGPETLFMHCLPAHRGDEVTASVVDGPNSVVFHQAANRLHAQKAVLAALLR